jgi:hypothetical protein
MSHDSIYIYIWNGIHLISFILIRYYIIKNSLVDFLFMFDRLSYLFIFKIIICFGMLYFITR